MSVKVSLLCFSLLSAAFAPTSASTLPAPRITCVLEYLPRGSTNGNPKASAKASADLDQPLALHLKGYFFRAILAEIQPPDYPGIWYELRLDLEQGTLRSGAKHSYELSQVAQPDFKDQVSSYLGDELSLAIASCAVTAQ